ncbi:dolichyl pyrophosphate Man9GlcNAc2 alpha-1,3-glucosyltransferase [Osmia lignaria lignaria]|uniref:dolichyl pyrophosphate Man9GlcNAc2 alpha-1,3-glucosyltransferase n=1 Tax=Osmia lignaria lignaria TaxID=1437193 RepID=UPI00402B56C9
MQESMQIVLISLLALLLRWCITYHPYSGQGKPPIFGDYEAQRHWQEITLNLPTVKWYTNTTDNDLLYWGLDYPPLTAYHSFALGYIANKINSSYVKLHESRGFESEDHKYFMRLSVFFMDMFTYVPSMIYYIVTNKTLKNIGKRESNIFGFTKRQIILLIVLIYPSLILIDNGHFQYNCVSLGLFIGAVAFILQNLFIIGSILFVAALNYKQMELYHALPIFFYILGKHLPLKQKIGISNLKMLLWISFTVIATFFIIWLPFLKNLETFASVILRLFPVSRGIFEDKVANIWCAVNVLYKLRNTFTNEQLAKLCLTITAFAVLPSSIDLYLNPKKEKFIISLINCALAFFLFSFQVHEKTILLVAIPILLYFQHNPFPCFWFLIISHFSMLPLFIKDDLYLAYCVTLIFYFLFVSWEYPDLFNSSESLNRNVHIMTNQEQIKTKLKRNKSGLSFVKVIRDTFHYCKSGLSRYDLYSWRITLFHISILGIIILSVVSGFLKPPNRYPDLFSLLVSIYSCAHFIIFYLYFNYKQFDISRNIINKVN